MTKQKLRKVENILRADIRWAIRSGLRWDPSMPARHDGEKWKSETPTLNPRRRTCGVCAIAAHVVHRQPPTSGCDVQAAARSLRVDEDWLDDVYLAVMDTARSINPNDAEALAYRLTDYAKVYTKAHRKAAK